MSISEDWDISTAFSRGRNALVVIKTGAGGSVDGYEGKYKRLAERIHQETGYAVLVIDNPIDADKEENFDVSMTAVEFSLDVTETDDGSIAPVYYIGFSSAAAMGAAYGYKYDFLNRMLLINPPLMINWHKQSRGLEKFEGEECVVAIGTIDPSYKYLGLVKNDKVLTRAVPGMNHQCAGCEDVIYDLISECCKFV